MIPALPFGSLPDPNQDPVVHRYRTLFAPLDWSLLPVRDPDRLWPGPVPLPPCVFAKALLVKIVEGKRSIPALRQFLLEHPALVLELGFRPVVDATDPTRLDLERTVPSERWLRYQQQHLLLEGVQRLLAATVAAVQQHDPTLGEVAALDVTHHYAWVRENNANQTLSPRYQAERQPRGDPDCRLGAKRRHPTPKRSQIEAFWGYHSGIMSAPTTLGDVVLAVHIQPVAPEMTVFAPLATQTVAVLGQPPTHLTADAAFDAWRVYDFPARHGGTAAIPLNPRRGSAPRSAEGHLCCAAGQVMTPTGTGRHRDGYRVRHYRCPLRGVAGATCAHPNFRHGGCTKQLNLEAGGQHRLALDRTSAAYRDLYRHRTCTERLFSRLKALGLDRPCARRLATVTRILTLGYLALNLLTLATYTTTHPHAAPLGP